MFQHINYITMRATYIAQEDGRLPSYLGSTVRGVLGHCMRAFICTMNNTKCYQCEERSKCSYARCFASPGNDGGAVNPFVLHVLIEGKTDWKVGDSCTFDLTLIGDMVNRAGIFIDALQAMSKLGWGVSRIPFLLEQVIDPDTKLLILSRKQSWMRNLIPHPLNLTEKSAGAVLLQFDTPVRIVSGGRLCKQITFDILIQFMSRRLSLLSQAYTGQLLKWDEEALLKEAEKVHTVQESWNYYDFKRYSMNQTSHKLALEAMRGWVIYEGNLTPFTPILEAGHILHVGKGATIGFGYYITSYDR